LSDRNFPVTNRIGPNLGRLVCDASVGLRGLAMSRDITVPLRFLKDVIQIPYKHVPYSVSSQVSFRLPGGV
uniref:BPI2 domain-containing protein n=1 Tax=Haemonchus placei TaxID=6290 RepID=A0A0N4X7K7_HAEPC